MIKSICFLTTYRCNARCDYCECGPKVRDRLTIADMRRLMDEGEEIGTVGQVVFSGGEPTLLGDDLLAAIAYATGKGMLTRVVTNGWWGKSPAAALDFVDRLLAAGLHEINLSVDDLHQRWIGIERVTNSFLACYARRLKCLIAHKRTKSCTVTKEYLEQHFGMSLIDYEPGQPYSEEEQCRLFSTGVVVPVGRNEDLADPEEMITSKWWGSCSSVLRDIVVGAKTNFLPCCGIVTKDIPDLTRSDLRTVPLIDAIESANNDLILNWIALEGPAAIAEAVKKWDPGIQLPDRFAGICHICNEVLSRPDVRSVIAEHVHEIAPRISLHRATFELARSDEDVMKMYLPA
jgi:organic radical activating enzyme